jgi:signal transduction histidine kinase
LAEVTGDDVQLRQIFVNLLVNAFQAMAERGGLVSVRTQTLGDHLEIDVADDGPGIPEHARELIFKPFYTTKPRGVGTGLGLPTARRIAELHGGSLELASTGPTGTLFRVRLRLAGVPV